MGPFKYFALLKDILRGLDPTTKYKILHSKTIIELFFVFVNYRYLIAATYAKTHLFLS